jgi:hypothetical protein
MNFQDKRLWAAVTAIVVGLIAAWMFGYIGGGAPAW